MKRVLYCPSDEETAPLPFGIAGQYIRRIGKKALVSFDFVGSYLVWPDDLVEADSIESNDTGYALRVAVGRLLESTRDLLRLLPVNHPDQDQKRKIALARRKAQKARFFAKRIPY